MRVLLDTCVVSELRQPNCDEQVKQTIATLQSEDLFLSVIVMGEIEKGVALLQQGRRKQALSVWLQNLKQDYADRILPIDLETVEIWGAVTDAAQKQGIVVPVCDGLIASTAQRYGLHLMTRNTSDFKATNVMLINPWQSEL